MNVESVDKLLCHECVKKWGIPIENMHKYNLELIFKPEDRISYTQDGITLTCELPTKKTTYPISNATWDCDNRNNIRNGEIYIVVDNESIAAKLFENNSLISNDMIILSIGIDFSISNNQQVVLRKPRIELSIPIIVKTKLPYDYVQAISFELFPEITFSQTS